MKNIEIRDLEMNKDMDGKALADLSGGCYPGYVQGYVPGFPCYPGFPLYLGYPYFPCFPYPTYPFVPYFGGGGMGMPGMGMGTGPA